jgi:hypothetical protein
MKKLNKKQLTTIINCMKKSKLRPWLQNLYYKDWKFYLTNAYYLIEFKLSNIDFTGECYINLSKLQLIHAIYSNKLDDQFYQDNKEIYYKWIGKISNSEVNGYPKDVTKLTTINNQVWITELGINPAYLMDIVNILFDNPYNQENVRINIHDETKYVLSNKDWDKALLMWLHNINN